MNIIHIDTRRGQSTRLRVADTLADHRERRAGFITRLLIGFWLIASALSLLWWWLP